MKTNNSPVPLSSQCYGIAMLAVVLFSMAVNPAMAQDRRGGGDRNGGGRQGGTREQAVRNQGDSRRQDWAMNRGNQGRELNQNRVPNTINRNVNPNRNNPASINRNFNGNRNYDAARRPVNNYRPGSLNRPGYRPVYGYNRPIYSPRNPSWQYGYLPRRNSYFYGLPSTYLSINFGGIGYRYWGGVFYRPYNNLFTVIAPPVGIFINVLPVGYRRIYVHDYPYYYYNGTYYDQRGPNYVVVSPPVGAVVESLPAGYETVVIDGETFYTSDGVQYKPVVQESGEIWYEVIKAN